MCVVQSRSPPVEANISSIVLMARDRRATALSFTCLERTTAQPQGRLQDGVAGVALVVMGIRTFGPDNHQAVSHRTRPFNVIIACAPYCAK
mmetsp:Transcript_30972/g.84631  ORF Transcript_30972/g.84631 Transcript_30972/m.84631 type:complete len:91 (-) Transcript_30972:426-698(-)|eukprot:scaffold104010_cov29-Tisochrysis_lutea.AAC.2